MPLHQYAYFALFSQHTTADEMTLHLGIAPDEVSVRGSRFTEPRPIPVSHCWKIVCRDPGLRVDEQIASILGRLQPHTDRIAAVARGLTGNGGGAVLQVVRYFDDTDQDKPKAADAPSLFGWHVDRSVLDFLSATGAELDVDEYDMTRDDEYAA
ncbi:DUF4279 domain-containing protein [Streptomyces actinomycinicus]|uniref:DUF4279 domain-containing protein n=1 Tax=Streptomyces actinomycinicus TaxID=1695166 RepID=A0A937EHN9_9ACTN|nr:DUF4279 domain-containing protein [Streptomyces actinomycinicus]MBL1082279.1 DUF4279 domain-containing protein [Streptomyces actinomycinicus]